MTEQIVEINKEVKLKSAVAATFIMPGSTKTVWSPEDVDKLEIVGLDDFKKIINECRFYYRRDPIASTVLNKLVEIGITDIVIDQGALSDNEYRVFDGIKDKLKEFIQNCALEYLITGIVVPEIRYAPVTKLELQKLGVKKYDSLTLPVSMWLRDPSTIKIRSTFVVGKPSYFIVLPDELVDFIRNGGKYSDGSRDDVLWYELTTYYQDFLQQVLNGNKEIPYYNDLIIRRKVITGSDYPTPYLYPALEPLKHKRNLRRMDYSIASRVITAIQLVQAGSDEFPVTENDSSVFDDLKAQMQWRNSSGDMERIFQLFANHTIKISWIFPNTDALLDEKKYSEVNQDIFWALGFPKILTTGETERTQTSDPTLAVISPSKTMENMQDSLLSILNDIVFKISTNNNFKNVPVVRFENINLHSIVNTLSVLSMLYSSGNISRETLDKEFGYNFQDEFEKRTIEDKKVAATQPEPTASPSNPNSNNQDNTSQDNKQNSKNITK